MQGLQDLGFTNEIDFTSTKKRLRLKFKVIKESLFVVVLKLKHF
jgi:hypothetical protein